MRYHSIRSMASRKSAADWRLRFLRRALRGFPKVAGEWLGGLLHAATLLADRSPGSELSRPVAVVGRAELKGPSHLAGKLSRQSDRHADGMASAGDARPDCCDARAARSDRQRVFQHAVVHVWKGRVTGEARGRSVRGKNFGAGIEVARWHSPAASGGWRWD